MSETPAPKIVIVEDEGLIASDLSRRLTTAGYAVPAIAASAQEALRAVRDTSPDLILMDIRIKGERDGIEVAQQVRDEFDVPVVYLTAYEDRETLQRASATQAYGYVKKPIASASLQGSIEMALAKHRHERYLREQRDWAVSSFSAVPFPVIVTDRRGNISFLNQQAESLTGSAADSALGRPIREVVRLHYRETGEQVEDLVVMAIRNGEAIALPNGVWIDAGDARAAHPVEGIVTPRWVGGSLDGALLVLRDSSLAVFEAGQARQQAKHEALRRMADMIVERLPDWQMIVWNTTLLVESLRPSSRLRNSAETVDRAALKAFDMGCRLSALAAPLELQLQRLSLQEWVADASRAWRCLVPSFSMEVEQEPMPVQADREQLHCAIGSILAHVRQRMAPGGAMVIEVRRPDLEPLRQWARIRFTYPTRNETAVTVERVFEPAASHSAPDLYGAYAGVTSMGGLLTAQAAGKEVSFDIYLRLSRAATAAAPLPPASAKVRHYAEVAEARRLVLR